MTLVSSDDDLDWEFAFDWALASGRPLQEPMAKRSKKWCEELPILHPDAAGIDVGASELIVAVGADRDPQPVRSFPTFTRDLNALRTGYSSAGFARWQWSQRVCTEFYLASHVCTRPRL